MFRMSFFQCLNPFFVVVILHAVSHWNCKKSDSFCGFSRSPLKACSNSFHEVSVNISSAHFRSIGSFGLWYFFPLILPQPSTVTVQSVLPEVASLIISGDDVHSYCVSDYDGLTMSVAWGETIESTLVRFVSFRADPDWSPHEAKTQKMFELSDIPSGFIHRVQAWQKHFVYQQLR